VARATFAVISLLLAITTYVAFRAVRSTVLSSWWVDHTLSVERELAALSSTNGELRAASLELLLTGTDRGDLEALRAASIAHLQQIAELTVDNASQQRRVATLRVALDADLASMNDVSGAHPDHRLVQSIIAEMVGEEEHLLHERRDRSSLDADRAGELDGLLGLLALLAMATGYVLVRSDERASRTAVDALRERDDREAALLRTRARLAALSEAGIIGVVVTTPDRRVLEINGALLDALGYTRDEIFSGTVPWKSLTPPEWAATDTSVLLELKATGVAALREKEYFHKNGSRVPVIFGSAVLADSQGETISFVLDVTANRQAALALEDLRQVRASEVMMRGLLEAAPDAVVIVDQEGKIFLVNTQTEQLFGYTRDELLGRDARMLVPERFKSAYAADRDGFAADLTVRRMSSGLRLSGERKDGGEFPLEISRGRLETHEGTLISCSIRDVTLRTSTEEALTAANAELEAFSYSVAHDLRAPLRGMNGFAQILLDTYEDKLDAEGQDWLQEILLNARKMGNLIDALLSLARVTRSGLHLERVDLSALAGAVVAQLAVSGRVVEVTIEPDLGATMDPRLARALLTNLLENAWKFTQATAAPAITFGALDQDGPATFFVRDNGAGFDMAFAGKLFVPFQRLHSNAEFAGTGIGLATVQRILRRHGGRAWAEGVVDGGATFFFTLPVHRAGALAA
jgi:PAS domain S-box-containing protein